MKKEIKISMITAILLLSFATISASSATVYTITNDSYGNYFNTTGYINNTNIAAGDVLDLSGTISNKNINVDRPLNITSTDKTAQILNGTITIYTAGSGTNVTDLTIINNNENGNGIFLYETENNTIQGNHIYCDGPFGFAIPITRSHHNNIIGNIITVCERDDTARTHTAIALGQSNYNTIADNYIQNDGANCIYLSIWGSGLFESDGPSYYNDIINNTCVGVDTSWCYAIQMMGSYNRAMNNTILSQTFPEKKSSYGTGAYRGISSENDEEGGNTITGNIISATYCGIYVNSNCIVSGNTVSSYKDANTATYTNNNGITAGNNCTLTDNIINMTSGGYGINLLGSNTSVTGNTISNVANGYGLYLVGSNNTVSENEITTTDTTKQSVYLYDASAGNNISQNTINSNTTGIMLKRKTTTKKPTNTTIDQNIITTTSTYAVDSYEGSATTITNNFLVSATGQGNAAVKPLTGDTVSGNYGIPTADFTAIPTNGTAPLQVTFNNTSTGNITSYAWDFDNNGTTDSTDTNPTYTYNTVGTYTVKLTVTGPGGSDEEIKTDYITVNTPTTPLADFTATPTNGSAPLQVTFTNTSTDAASYAWDFDNNGTTDSTDTNPFWTYNTPGTYTVKLTVTGPGGSDDEVKTDYITVFGTPDLLSGDLQVPSSPIIAIAYPVSATVTNSGTADVSAFIVKLYDNNTQVAKINLTGLASGASTPVTFNWTPTTTGNHVLAITADTNNEITESNETNNLISTEVSVNPSTQPDLTVTNLQISTNPTIGTTYPVIVTVTNQGTVNADAFTVKLYDNNTQIAKINLTELAAGASTDVTFNWLTYTTGTHNLSIIADANGQISEYNEANNQISQQVSVGASTQPDLTVTDLQIPANPTAGTTYQITVTVTVTNNGTVDAAAFAVKLYDNNTQVMKVNLTGLAAGTSTQVTFNWTPTTGTHNLAIKVDANNQITEYNENNNIITQEINVTS